MPIDQARLARIRSRVLLAASLVSASGCASSHTVNEAPPDHINTPQSDHINTPPDDRTSAPSADPSASAAPQQTPPP